MLIQRRLVKEILSKRNSISFEHLVQYFTEYKPSPDPENKLFTASDFADECMRITEGANEEIVDDGDPFNYPVEQRSFPSSQSTNDDILILKNNKSKTKNK